MRMLILALFVALGLAVPEASIACGEQYGVSISASEADPTITHTYASPPGDFALYLWLTCSPDGGINFFGADLIASYDVLEFVTSPDVLNAGSADSLLLVAGPCPQAPFLLGHWAMRNASGVDSGSVCLGGFDTFPPPSGIGVDCDCLSPKEDDVGVTGFSAGTSVSCEDPNGCVQPTSVDRASWGNLKALYQTLAN